MSRIFQCKSCGAVRSVSKTSKFVGVDYHKASKRYRCRITVNGSQVFIGCFVKEDDAGHAYDEYVLANNIENRPLNFLSKVNHVVL